MTGRVLLSFHQLKIETLVNVVFKINDCLNFSVIEACLSTYHNRGVRTIRL